MKFWQAFVIAEMAAGAVWADRYYDILWLHALADAGNVALSFFMWRFCEWLSDPTPSNVEKER